MSGTTFWILLVGSNGACVFLGFLLGRLTRAAATMEKIMSDETGPPRDKRKVTATGVIAVSVALVGAMTAAVGVILARGQSELGEDQHRLNECMIGYSNGVADAIEQRAKASAETFEQIDLFMQAIVQAYADAPADGRERVRRSVENYLRERENAKQTLQDNPLPEAPRDACAELLDE